MPVEMIEVLVMDTGWLSKVVVFSGLMAAAGLWAETNTHHSAAAVLQSKETSLYRCELESAEYSGNVSRKIIYQSYDDSKAVKSGNRAQLNITILVFGPKEKKFTKGRFDKMAFVGRQKMPFEHWDDSETPKSKLEKVVDETGKDLIGRSTSLMWESRDNDFFKFHHKKSPPDLLGTIRISNLESPADKAKKLTALKGVMYLSAITDEGKVEIKPLSAHFNAPIALPEGESVTINLLEKNTIYYTIAWKAKNQKDADPDLSPQIQRNFDKYQFKFFTADGKELQSGGYGSRGSETEAKYDVSLGGEQQFGEGAYAVVTFPQKTQVVEIPFEFKDVQLPEGAGSAAPQGESPSPPPASTTTPREADKKLRDLQTKAETGDAKAQYTLGERYLRDPSSEEDPDPAAIWFQKAADQGNLKAQAKLGWMYVEGNRVFQNEIRGIRMLKKAAEGEEPEAWYHLGMCYRGGHGVKQDNEKAFQWLSKAAEKNHAEAQFRVGMMFQEGAGVSKDDVKSTEYFRKSALQGFADGQVYLAYNCVGGKGVKKDWVEAVRWYRRAAEQGSHAGINNLSLIYAAGEEGVPKDNVEAYFWTTIFLREECMKNDKFFTDHLEKIKAQMTPDQIEAGKRRVTEYDAWRKSADEK
ncbi:MAG: sel1 repeat family protein [Verrucomicrobia bacterium]|nr:sel1 repeat family protein [Verrucomicrobiota bacterium]